MPKNFVQDKWAILGQKMTHPQLWNFLKILQKGANRYMEILLVVFREKNSCWGIWSF